MVKVVDLFAGMGGLASGFAKEGFSVSGYDIRPATKKIFRLNGIGDAEIRDLSSETVSEKADVVTGGPPCRPWSSINITLRRGSHPDYKLLDSFFNHILEIKPAAFIMENVPPLGKDPNFIKWVGIIRESGYSVSYSIAKYSDYGASTSRRRLFVIGFNDGNQAEEFFSILEEYKNKPKTVMDAIRPFINLKKGDFPDHEWPNLKTIHKYEKYYRTGRYGWYKLDPDKPAPSFGNIMKTYILHPMSNNGTVPRVISVREAMAIMGFDTDFRFPENMGMSTRYQMIADAVSPVFSRICAKIIKKMLW